MNLYINFNVKTMINLKLAEYNEKGEFEKFLELGKDFGYYGNQIHVLGNNACNWEWCDIDKKDPLKRFGCQFNGRTYSKGRFVLVEYKTLSRGLYCDEVIVGQDDIIACREYGDRLHRSLVQIAYSFDDFEFWKEVKDQQDEAKSFRILGNLHENPELYRVIG